MNAIRAFFISAAVLALEVSLTRVFSVVLWYHFGFMIVSLAMLGFAFAGAAVHFRAAKGKVTAGTSSFHSLVAAALLLPVVIALTRIPVDPTQLIQSPTDQVLFGAVILLASVPLFLLGFALCAAFEAGRDAIGRVYGASFLGGAAGVGLSLAGMEYLGGGGGLLLAAGAAWIAGIGRSTRWLALASAIVVALCMILAPGIIPTHSQKHFPNVSDEQVIDRKWNAFSSVVFYKNPKRHGLWAMPDSYPGPLPETLGIAIDEWAITSIVRMDGETDLGFFEAYPPTLGLETAKMGFDALVIGAGGGLDVLGALHFGAGHVTAVELNPMIVDAVKGEFREYSGDLYHDERVRAVAEEGRHFVERDEKKYDRIVLTGVDTFAATAAGAYALSENYIYTVEAFQSYLDHLKPDGMLCMTRWFYDPPRQTLRLIAAAREALEREGIAKPEACFFLARARLRSLILVKNEPFTEEEKQVLINSLPEREAVLIHAPGWRGHPIIDAFMAGTLDPDYAYRVDEATDDNPFLFEHGRWKNLFGAEQDWFMDQLGGLEVLFLTFAGLFACMALGTVLLLFLGRGTSWLRVDPRLAAFFFLLGAGYLITEAVLLPKLVLCLGHPVYAMSIVLISLLVFSGLGAVASQRMPRGGRWLAIVCTAAAASFPLFFLLLFDALQPQILQATLTGKIALIAAVIAVPGFLMGLPFPLALRNHAGMVPRAFLFNGAGSALAGPAATALAITFGFTTTFWIASGLYLVAGLLVAGVRRK